MCENERDATPSTSYCQRHLGFLVWFNEEAMRLKDIMSIVTPKNLEYEQNGEAESWRGIGLDGLQLTKKFLIRQVL